MALEPPPYTLGSDIAQMTEAEAESLFDNVVFTFYNNEFSPCAMVDSYVSAVWESNLTDPDKLTLEIDLERDLWQDLREATSVDISIFEKVTTKKTFHILSKSLDFETNRIKIEAKSIDALFELRRPWPYWLPVEGTHYTNDWGSIYSMLLGNGGVGLDFKPINNSETADEFWNYRVLQNRLGNGKVVIHGGDIPADFQNKMRGVARAYPDKSNSVRDVIADIQARWNIRIDTYRVPNEQHYDLWLKLPLWHELAVLRVGYGTTVQFSESLGTFKTTRLQTIPDSDVGATYFKWQGWLSDPNVDRVINAGGDKHAAGDILKNLWGSQEFTFEGDMVFHTDTYSNTMMFGNRQLAHKDVIYWLYNKDYRNTVDAPESPTELMMGHFWNGKPPNLGYRAETTASVTLPDNPIRQINTWNSEGDTNTEVWEYREHDRRLLWNWGSFNHTAQLSIMQQAEANREVSLSGLLEGEVIPGSGYTYLVDYEVGSIVSVESPYIPFEKNVSDFELGNGEKSVLMLARVESVSVTWDSSGVKVTPKLNPDFPRTALDGNIPITSA